MPRHSSPSTPLPLALNEDNSHFFCWHPAEEMSGEGVDAWLDRYAGTLVTDLLLCPNGQRSGIPSHARQTVWDGFDPKQGNDQPFFQGMRDQPFLFAWGARAHMRRWVEHAWLLHSRGIDFYARCLARCRVHGIRPWFSMRMNDVHYVDEPDHPIHDRFWKNHREFRRDPDHDAYNGHCFDYGIAAVREYQLAYVRELVAAYDIDGFELDWMRNPFHFAPGAEAVGARVLTEFVAEVRTVLDARAGALGHPIRLSVRVPSRPDTAIGLGLDAVTWARRRLVDRIVVTPFFSTTEFDVPVERWQALLAGTGTTLMAGLEISVRMGAGPHTSAHTLATLRGAATSYLDRGADGIYLFNFMDNYPAGTMGEAYRRSAPAQAYHQALRQVTDLTAMVGRCRRHVVTSPDVWAPGQTQAALLPHACAAGSTATFRLPTGPPPIPGQAVQVRLAVEPADAGQPCAWTVVVNGVPCAPAAELLLQPDATEPVRAYTVPAGVLGRGDTRIDVGHDGAATARVTWLELALSESDGTWPASGPEATSLYPGWGRW
jgi:hypothetical protein